MILKRKFFNAIFHLLQRKFLSITSSFKGLFKLFFKVNFQEN